MRQSDAAGADAVNAERTVRGAPSGVRTRGETLRTIGAWIRPCKRCWLPSLGQPSAQAACSPGTSASGCSIASPSAEEPRRPAGRRHGPLRPAQQRGRGQRGRRGAQGLRAGVRVRAGPRQRDGRRPSSPTLVRQVRRDGQIRETELVIQRAGRHAAARHRAGRSARLPPGAGAGRGPHPRAPGRGGTPRLRGQRQPRAEDARSARSSCSPRPSHDASDDPEAVERFAGRMLKESDRLTHLVQQIIELSRLQGDDPLEQPAAGLGRRASSPSPSTPAPSTPRPRRSRSSRRRRPACASTAARSRSRSRSATWSRTRSPTPARSRRCWSA